ncbi:MAG: hypothetical protein JO266_10540, partial [Acidobacteria bacterium]|nr:hypothetical protein [Acidobacteriota bacterium]
RPWKDGQARRHSSKRGITTTIPCQPYLSPRPRIGHQIGPTSDHLSSYETGVNEKLGYNNPSDLVERYPQFYWNKVERYIGDGLRYLEMTTEGRQWTSTLYGHIFAIEHNRRRMGPQPGLSPQQR